MGHIKDFWNGNIRLVVSYWVFGVIVVGLIYMINSFLLVSLEIQTQIWINLLIFLPYIIFWGVGTWRSAKNYRKEWPKRAIWGYLAQFMVFFSWVNNFNLYAEMLRYL